MREPAGNFKRNILTQNNYIAHVFLVAIADIWKRILLNLLQEYLNSKIFLSCSTFASCIGSYYTKYKLQNTTCKYIHIIHSQIPNTHSQIQTTNYPIQIPNTHPKYQIQTHIYQIHRPKYRAQTSKYKIQTHKYHMIICVFVNYNL